MDNILSEILGLVPGQSLVTVRGTARSGEVQGVYARDEMGYVVIQSTDPDKQWECAIPEQSIWFIARWKGEPPDTS